MPGWQVSETKQDISVTAGNLWNASVYGKITNDLGSGEAYLETIFFDSSSAETGKLASTKYSGVMDWTLLTNVGTIPVDTVTASYRLMVFTIEAASADGTVYFDDADATAVPEPATLLLLGSGLVGLLGFVKKKR